MRANDRRQRLLGACVTVLAAAIVSLAGPASGADTPTGSLSMGPQAMGGNMKLAPGDVLKAGYSFTIPGKHPEATVRFLNGSVAFQATCASGSGQIPIVISLPDASHTVAESSSAWYPSGDQHNDSVYQGSTTVPDVCAGGLVGFRLGGTFTAGVTGDVSNKVNVRWHYSANGSSGSWSGTGSVIPGTDIIDVCPPELPECQVG